MVMLMKLLNLPSLGSLDFGSTGGSHSEIVKRIRFSGPGCPFVQSSALDVNLAHNCDGALDTSPDSIGGAGTLPTNIIPGKTGHVTGWRSISFFSAHFQQHISRQLRNRVRFKIKIHF